MKLSGKIRIVICFLFVIGFCRLYAEEKIDPRLWEKAVKIHWNAIVVDTHSDTPMAMLEDGVDIGKTLGAGDVDLIRMKKGGLDAMFFAAFVSNNQDDKNPAKSALELIDEVYRQVEMYPALAKMAYSPKDIVKIHQEGKRAILIGIENGGPLEGSIRLLRDFYRLGVRYITLTHNSNNNICDSSMDEKPRWNGLSPFGMDVVREMNRLGMLIDVSHISDKAFEDVIRLSQAPVFASHSCVRSICDSPRNMSDEMIKSLAKKGGVIQINFYSEFVDQEYKNKMEETKKLLEPEIKQLKEKYKNDRKMYWKEYFKMWQGRGPAAPPIENLMKHIDYIVKLVGVDYVGLGSDFDGAGSFPVGLENVTGYPLITYHLLKRGYKEGDIKKILGGNFLRVFDSVIRSSSKGSF